MLTRALEKEGWNVLQAKDGLTAIERIKKQRPDLILLDLIMPNMNGYQFVTELHKTPEWQSIPIVVVTAGDVTSRDRARLDGYVEKVLRKSALNEDSLLAEIRDLISKSVQREAQSGNKLAPEVSEAQS
jgi:CheY-like chemotaxis protein